MGNGLGEGGSLSRVLDLSARLINAHPTKVLVDYVLRIIPFLYFSSALIASIESVQSGAR